MQHPVDVVVALAGRHPAIALSLAGIIAFTESLATIGTKVPAAMVMFGAGALVGHETIELGWALGVARAWRIMGWRVSSTTRTEFASHPWAAPATLTKPSTGCTGPR
jgi:hypothetical protein